MATLEIDIGNECNISCTYCFIKNKEKTSNFVKILKTLISLDLKKITTLRILSGEPLMVSKINKINTILKLIDNEVKLILITNGINLKLIDELFIDKKNIDLIISLDTFSEKNLRCLNNDKIEYIKSYILNNHKKFNYFSINRVLYGQSEDEIIAFDSWFANLGIDVFDINLNMKNTSFEAMHLDCSSNGYCGNNNNIIINKNGEVKKCRYLKNSNATEDELKNYKCFFLERIL